MIPIVHALLLAQATPEIPTSLGGPTKHALGSTTIVIIVVLGLAALLVGWAVFLRKPARRRERGRLVEAPSEESSSGGRRRRRRSRHRARNPTRAEVGGLPPLGAGDTSKPPL